MGQTKTYYKQEQDYTCAIAVMRMVFARFGLTVPSEEEIMSEVKCEPNSPCTTPEAVYQYMLSKGFDVVQGEVGSIEEIDRYKQEGWEVGLMISVDVPHFTLYSGQNGNHIFFDDPFYGEHIARLISKFTSDKTSYPVYRWRVYPEETKKYFPQAEIDDQRSYHGFIAFKK